MARTRGTPRPKQRSFNIRKPIRKISTMLAETKKICDALYTAQNALNEARKMTLGNASRFEFKFEILPKNQTTPEKSSITASSQLTPSKSSASKSKPVKRLSQSGDEENKRFACNDCRRRYGIQEELERHVVMKHERETTRRSLLRQNMSPMKPLTPTIPKSQHSAAKKQFECDYCDKKFIQKFYFEKHLETHSGNSTFNSSTDTFSIYKTKSNK